MSRIKVKNDQPPTQEEVFTTDQRSQAGKGKARMESGTKAEGDSWPAV